MPGGIVDGMARGGSGTIRGLHWDAGASTPEYLTKCERGAGSYSPELFAELFDKRIAILTYHKFPRDDWPVEQFAAHRVELPRARP